MLSALELTFISEWSIPMTTLFRNYLGYLNPQMCYKTYKKGNEILKRKH